MDLGVSIETEWDFSGLDRFVKRLNELESYEVEYGFYSTQRHPESDLSLADIALINENGSPAKNIPSRPFMWQSALGIGSVKENLYAYRQIMFYDRSIEQQLRRIGSAGKRHIKTIIERGMFAANSPLTIAIKGTNSPLIETGYLKDHAKFKVSKTTGGSDVMGT